MIKILPYISILIFLFSCSAKKKYYAVYDDYSNFDYNYYDHQYRMQKRQDACILIDGKLSTKKELNYFIQREKIKSLSLIKDSLIIKEIYTLKCKSLINILLKK
ncbi:hypothetical protein CHA01nite_36900 [Chryseobacterium hagamense]|uniref:Lipoprotein n=1 Tax=Chryseobacterium hagamense TaxID=395935 RepID=A0A511YRX8_9FLAO|nr:hypothetical protein CHA01nite_36900 [Chryseobacterium hagamense]